MISTKCKTAVLRYAIQKARKTDLTETRLHPNVVAQLADADAFIPGWVIRKHIYDFLNSPERMANFVTEDDLEDVNVPDDAGAVIAYALDEQIFLTVSLSDLLDRFGEEARGTGSYLRVLKVSALERVAILDEHRAKRDAKREARKTRPDRVATWQDIPGQPAYEAGIDSAGHFVRVRLKAPTPSELEAAE